MQKQSIAAPQSEKVYWWFIIVAAGQEKEKIQARTQSQCDTTTTTHHYQTANHVLEGERQQRWFDSDTDRHNVAAWQKGRWYADIFISDDRFGSIHAIWAPASACAFERLSNDRWMGICKSNWVLEKIEISRIWIIIITWLAGVKCSVCWRYFCWDQQSKNLALESMLLIRLMRWNYSVHREGSHH